MNIAITNSGIAQLSLVIKNFTTSLRFLQWLLIQYREINHLFFTILTDTAKAVALVSGFTATFVGAYGVDTVCIDVAPVLGGIAAFVDILNKRMNKQLEIRYKSSSFMSKKEVKLNTSPNCFVIQTHRTDNGQFNFFICSPLSRTSRLSAFDRQASSIKFYP